MFEGKIGFIGLGIMGRPMAKNLIRAGYSLTVYDKYAAFDDITALGAQKASSCRETASKSDMVITMLPNSPHVREAILGKDGVAEGIKSGAIVIDMSSIAPAVSREVGEALKAKGVSFLDAPVSGGEPKAIDGTLAIMAGGEKDVFEKARPVLEKMGSSAVLVGDLGAGNVTKLANQIIVALKILPLWAHRRLLPAGKRLQKVIWSLQCCPIRRMSGKPYWGRKALSKG